MKLRHPDRAQHAFGKLGGPGHRKGDVLEHRPVGEKPPRLEHHPHLAAQRVKGMRVELVDHLARDLDGAAVRFRLAADQPEQGRFPRAACAQDRDELAARNLQVQPLQELPRAVGEFDAGDLDQIFRGGVHIGGHSAWSSATVPSPPSAQMLTTARLPLGIAASSFSACERMRAPVAPNGWPRATEPPFGLSRSKGNLPGSKSTPTFSRRKLALSKAARLHSTWAENASWISHSAMSA